MENLLSGIPNLVSYLDDIFVTGKDYAEHLTTLKAVFNRLQQFGLRLKLPSIDSFNNRLSIGIISLMPKVCMPNPAK